MLPTLWTGNKQHFALFHLQEMGGQYSDRKK